MPTPPLTLEESLDLPDLERAIYYALYHNVGAQWNKGIMGKFETLTMGYRDTVRKCKVDGNVRKIAQVAWENWGEDLSQDESIPAPHATLAEQMDSQQHEISSLRAEMAAQLQARNAEALAAEQQAQEKVKAHELRISGAVDFLMGSGSGHSRSEAIEAVRGSLALPWRGTARADGSLPSTWADNSTNYALVGEGFEDSTGLEDSTLRFRRQASGGKNRSVNEKIGKCFTFNKQRQRKGQCLQQGLATIPENSVYMTGCDQKGIQICKE